MLRHVVNFRKRKVALLTLQSLLLAMGLCAIDVTGLDDGNDCYDEDDVLCMPVCRGYGYGDVHSLTTLSSSLS